MMIIRLYAKLLRLYPRGFYERFGAEMLAVFTQAWQDRPRTTISVAGFSLHEFGGLLLSIMTEHGHFRVIFRRRLVPVWLFLFSLITAGIFSLNYWGYLTVPASTISNLHTIDSIALVRFDADYNPSVIPLNDLPYLITPDFPPSQILTAIPQNMEVAETLDPALAAAVTVALSRERLELGVIQREFNSEPVINPNGCGTQCFYTGIQLQADGSLLETYPKIGDDGAFKNETFSVQVTPNDWWYYTYIMPAGYVVQGRDANGEALIFTTIASGDVSNDHHRYYELTFTPALDGLIVRDRLSYNFDIAGIEGFNLVTTTIFLFLPLVFVWYAILLVGTIITLIGRRTRQPVM